MNAIFFLYVCDFVHLLEYDDDVHEMVCYMDDGSV